LALQESLCEPGLSPAPAAGGLFITTYSGPIFLGRLEST
jgi:hypothetical protein